MTTTQHSTDRTVENSGVGIATRDYGGHGRPVLLMHGFGRNLEDWAVLVPQLVGSHRVVAMDLRGHGRSAVGPWTWPAVVGDIKKVTEQYGLDSPILIGHSLGGMIAVLYAATEPDVPAVINVDGHGSLPEERRAALIAVNINGLPGAGEPIDEAEVSTVKEASIIQWAGLAVPREVEAAEFDRSLHRLEDGRFQSQPTGVAGAEILGMAYSLDLSALYPRTDCPVLVFNAVGKDRGDDTLGVSWWSDFARAYREMVSKRLAAVAAENSHVSVETVDATHYVMVSHAKAVADRIQTFLSSVRL
jgi:pimeloyl-ACP methyl ester carboxylesterase